MPNTVLVGMSGGVDSSAAVLLLLDAGYDAAGLTLRLCGDGGTAEADARQAAARLGIAHFTEDLRPRFAQLVMEPFIEEYERGRTPNPCILCNRTIKFGEMRRIAAEKGRTYLATGHYVRKRYDAGSGRYMLERAADRGKDQSYFLYSLTQQQLAAALFPMGEYTKAEAREMAGKAGLLNADRPDSQDICFVPGGDYAAFIEAYRGHSYPPGDFVWEDGRPAGRHKGLIRYTVGQRKGLGVAFGRPVYVVHKDASANRVVLGDEPSLFSRRVLLSQVNLQALERMDGPLKVQAKARYRQKEEPATVHPLDENRALLEFDRPQRAMTPGQAAVFYDGDVLIGGGVIEGAEE